MDREKPMRNSNIELYRIVLMLIIIAHIVEVDFRQISGVELSIGAFPRHSEKWGWFVLNNRLTPDILSTYNIVEHNQDGKYDVCYGEIADGNIANIAYEVNNGLLELKKSSIIVFEK